MVKLPEEFFLVFSVLLEKKIIVFSHIWVLWELKGLNQKQIERVLKTKIVYSGLNGCTGN